MIKINDNDRVRDFWSLRYQEERTGWDIGSPSTPLKAYIDQIEDKSIHILIPGAGNAYEAEYLHEKGFTQVTVLDIAREPLEAFKTRVPTFPRNHLKQGNFFDHVGEYDLIFEQTFFCSFPPLVANRQLYVERMSKLLRPGGKLVGVWFDIPLTEDMVKRPFGGTKREYSRYLTTYLEEVVFERCYNSIPPRAGTELFGIFRKSSPENEVDL